MLLFDKKTPIVADGAIGEYLFSLKFPGRYLACEAVLRTPEILSSIHREYAEAGAKILTTNTFDANLMKLDMHGLADQCTEINRRAVEIAGRNTGCIIGGAIGPLNIEHSFKHAESDPEFLRKVFAPQIEGLLEGNPALIMLETQVDPKQAKSIYNLVRSLSETIPISVSFTFDNDIRTPAGFTLRDCIDIFRDSDIILFGANHGTGPLQALEIHRQLKEFSPFPIILQPNSGTGKYVDGAFVFPENPEHYVRCMLTCADSGIAAIGGCCGTTPAFTSMLAGKLETDDITRISFTGTEIEKETPSVGDSPAGTSALSVNLAKKDALLLELLPPRGASLTRFLRLAQKANSLSPVTLTIPDSPMGKVRISPDVIGLVLKERLSIEPLIHFTLRDRSLTRIQSDLLGLSASGIKDIFLIAGDPPSLGDYPEATAIYDLSTDDCLKLLANLQQGLNMNNVSIGQGTDFFSGTAIMLGDPQKTEEKIRRRWKSGCRFFITQPIYSIDCADQLFELMHKFPIIPALMPFRSKKSAAYLASEVPGISVPQEVLAKIDSMEDDDVLAYSIDILGELMQELRGLAAGVYLAGPLEGCLKLGQKWREGS